MSNPCNLPCLKCGSPDVNHTFYKQNNHLNHVLVVNGDYFKHLVEVSELPPPAA